MEIVENDITLFATMTDIARHDQDCYLMYLIIIIFISHSSYDVWVSLCLQMAGMFLFQMAIIEYLDETREGQRLLPKDSLHRAQVAMV